MSFADMDSDFMSGEAMPDLGGASDLLGGFDSFSGSSSANSSSSGSNSTGAISFGQGSSQGSNIPWAPITIGIAGLAALALYFKSR